MFLAAFLCLLFSFRPQDEAALLDVFAPAEWAMEKHNVEDFRYDVRDGRIDSEVFEALLEKDKEDKEWKKKTNGANG